jgi:hypothetical protein
MSLKKSDPREIFEHLPFPFEGGVFPAQLGAVVQVTVLDGKEPAREVIHTEDNSWLIGDGIGDPNLPGASTIAHIWHVVGKDPTLEPLASLSLGQIAQRDELSQPWRISQHQWADEP